MPRLSVAARLLESLAEAHRLLLDRVDATPGLRDGLTAVHTAATAAIEGLEESELFASPAPDTWSMAEVLEHMVDHDRHFVEIALRGSVHYVEHGLEHALQLWSLRRDRPPDPDAGDGPQSGTLE